MMSFDEHTRLCSHQHGPLPLPHGPLPSPLEITDLIFVTIVYV